MGLSDDPDSKMLFFILLLIVQFKHVCKIFHMVQLKKISLVNHKINIVSFDLYFYRMTIKVIFR